jgi:hypothetical protein
VIRVGMGPQPSHGRLHVMDRGGKRMHRSEPIRHRHRHVAAFREFLAERVEGLPFAGSKATAVDADDGRKRPASLAWHRQGLNAAIRRRERRIQRLACCSAHWEGLGYGPDGQRGVFGVGPRRAGRIGTSGTTTKKRLAPRHTRQH